MPSQVTELIRQRVTLLNKKGKPVRKPARAAYPISQEVKYRKVLFDHIKFIRNQFNISILPFLADQKKEVEAEKRRDQIPDELEQNLQIVKTRSDQDLPPETQVDLARNIAFGVSGFNLMQQQKVFTSALGASPIFTPVSQDTTMKLFIKNNVQLIKSINTQFFDRIEQLIYNNLRQGLPVSELRKQISAEFRKTYNRARLIAEDQIQKLNGNLTEIRQRSVGVESYKWRNMQDRRVRGNPVGLYPDSRYNHWNREGKTYSWTKPPPDGHPGQAIRCRCFPEPVFEENIKEALAA